MMKVLVFDLDDTLYKEQDYLISAFNEISFYIERKFGLHGIYKYMMKAYNLEKNVFVELNNHYHLPISIEEYLSMYRNHHPNLILSENVLSTLEWLKNNSYVMGIITDGRSVTQRNKISSLKLYNYFSNENIIISEEFGYSKPNEKNYSYFEKKYPLSEYFYIGDNPEKDFITPNRRKWTTVCLLDDGRNVHRQVIEDNDFAPNYRIDKMEDLIKIL